MKALRPLRSRRFLDHCNSAQRIFALLEVAMTRGPCDNAAAIAGAMTKRDRSGVQIQIIAVNVKFVIERKQIVGHVAVFNHYRLSACCVRPDV